MYLVNESKTNITKLEKRLFKDLGIQERKHLQEWIAKNPEILGEPLLIIQKEFAGFSDTHERLDLLALDKDGGLVIIENKLDDTGKNVVWQALKYTSYCSTLKSEQVVTLYQQYLDQNEGGGNARENLLEFMETDNDKLLLNEKDQRIFFVANDYRKEVTSTVMWLLDHDVKIQCFRAVPYSLGQDIFLQVEQIIPVPETSEFMIEIKEKEKEEKSKSKAVEESRARLVRFWNLAKQELSRAGFNHLDSVSAKHYTDFGFIKGAGRYSMCLGRSTIRVEINIPNDPDKTLINGFIPYKGDIEEKLGRSIELDNAEGKKSSKIKLEYPTDHFYENFADFEDEENWPKRVEWLTQNMVKFYNAVQPYADKVLKGKSYNG